MELYLIIETLKSIPLLPWYNIIMFISMYFNTEPTFIHFLLPCSGKEVAESVEDKDIPVLTLLEMCVKEGIIDTDQVHQ